VKNSKARWGGGTGRGKVLLARPSGGRAAWMGAGGAALSSQYRAAAKFQFFKFFDHGVLLI